jgi:FAD/FMN-containing dehydrogenase
MNTRRNFLKKASSLCTAAAVAISNPSIAFAKKMSASLDRIRGKIIRKSDANYKLWWASMVWYVFKPELYPDLIIKAKDDKDVIEAVNYARENGHRISIRSGGHNPARAVLRDGGVLLDLSALREVSFNSAEKTAWLQPGIRSEEFIELAREHDLAFPAAHTGIVPMGGYLIGGGLGWNWPEWDISCRSILAAEIVLADGRKVIASETENQDLLWTVRGVGPGFFGVVTRYKLQMFPLPKSILKSKYLVPIDKLPEVIVELESITKAKSNKLELLAVAGHFYPPNKPVEQQQLVCAITAIAFADSKKEVFALMDPVTRSKISGMSILQKENDEIVFQDLYIPPPTDFASPNRSIVENIWTDEPGKSLQLLADRLKNNPPSSNRSFVLTGWGVSPDKDDSNSSFTYFGDHYVSWYAMAEEEAHLEPNVAWMEETVKAIQPYTNGHYVNEIDPRHFPDHVKGCFSEEKWQRLAKLRLHYDPDNLFHTYINHS